MTTPGSKVTVTFAPPPEDLPRRHRKFLNNAHREAAEFHWKKHIPLHFDPSAFRRYGYAPRGRSYVKLKARLYGEEVARLPNVLTGNTRRVFRTQRQITATASNARLILRLPFKGGSGRLLDAAALKRLGRSALSTRQINGQRNIIARIAEMETVIPAEYSAIASVIEASYQRQADEAGVPRKVTFQ